MKTNSSTTRIGAQWLLAGCLALAGLGGTAQATQATTPTVAQKIPRPPATPKTPVPQPPSEAAPRSWCDPATWGGAVPGAGADVVLQGTVLLDCAAEARTVLVPPGAVLVASRSVDASLTLQGNLVVKGRLDLGTPTDRALARTEIVFKGMRDTDYTGTPSAVVCNLSDCLRGPPADTPLQVLDSDVGLWVVDDGVFTAAGRPKQAWTRLTSTTGPGVAAFTVEDASGWQAGDRILLTPTARASVPGFARQFDERLLGSVSANQLVLGQAPAYEHLGCVDCLRRGEAANLTRNVVVRSFDDTAHAHLMVAQRAVLQLDSVELRWLGPLKDCSSGEEPPRRAALYFHQQNDASAASFVRHVAIWGGEREFFVAEKSNGIDVRDVVGYDAKGGAGFERTYDNAACGLRCTRPAGGLGWVNRVNFTHVLAAKVAVPNRARANGCNAIGVATGMSAGGGDTVDSVVTGVSYNYGAYGNEAGIVWSETGSGSAPTDLFNRNTAHNNAGNGISNWQNTTVNNTPYDGNAAWSNGAYGLLAGAYGNDIFHTRLTAVDNAKTSFAIKGTVLASNRMRLDGALLDQAAVVKYTFVPTVPLILSNLTFTGARSPAFTQLHDPCVGGNENNPDDASQCIRVWLRIVNPQVPAGVLPFDFGDHQNKHSVWEVRGFAHPDHPTLPANFDLHRRDNTIAGGSYNAAFDAWLVPR